MILPHAFLSANLSAIILFTAHAESFHPPSVVNPSTGQQLKSIRRERLIPLSQLSNEFEAVANPATVQFPSGTMLRVNFFPDSSHTLHITETKSVSNSRSISSG